MSEADSSLEQDDAETPVSEPNDSAEDRRQTYRLNKVLGATLVTEAGKETSTRLFIIDISATGFRATDHRPPGEEKYEISIVLTKGEAPFVSTMRVVWVKELTVSGMFQMGCEFVDPKPEEARKLIDFIDTERKKLAAPAAKGLNIGSPWTMG